MLLFLRDLQSQLCPPPLLETEYSEHTWLRIVAFTFLWWVLYWVVLRISGMNPEWCCRILTFTHGTCVTTLAVRDILSSPDMYDYVTVLPMTPYQLYYLSFTFSYFIYDIIWIKIFGSEQLTIYLHHFCSILLLIKLITTSTGGLGIAYGMAGLEFTNPYLQARWFLRTHGYYNNCLYHLVELWFITSFLCIRMIGGTLLLYQVEIHPCMDLTLKTAFIGMYCVSILLTVQILKFTKRKYLKWLNWQFSRTASVLSIFPSSVVYRYPTENETENTE